ncbi:MAG: PIG-L deacetylase family protein [Candidatus Longimicrobiales bacterium M2_2A_002]
MTTSSGEEGGVPMAGRRLLAVLAHPDDESLGMGGVLARYASEDVATHLVTATRGEAGRYYGDRPRPSDAEVGRVRERELRSAAAVLGVADVEVLGYPDGGLDRVPVQDVLARLVPAIRRVRPQVVVTFDPFGAYGHPDHIAISQLSCAAVTAAADPDYLPGSDGSAHRVSKLYYMAWDESTWAAYQEAFKTLTSTVDGAARRAMPWPGWSITTRVDTRAWWETVWEAVQCHKTQMAIYGRLAELSPEHHRGLWGTQTFYRVFSTVNGGRETETDLFTGIDRGVS